ncbi:MAG: NUDIX domain-containing protein [Desulfovibrionales bacterium]
MPKQSAGLLPFRSRQGRVEVFLVHMGGPFWKKKDESAWTLPKGELQSGEAPLKTAIREFHEETGLPMEAGEFIDLGSVRQKSGKIIFCWAFEGDLDPTRMKSNTFTLEWPPRSGIFRDFPEADKGEWFPLDIAQKKMVSGQAEFLHRLISSLSGQHGIKA